MSDVDLQLLRGRRMAVVSFSPFPADPRPRRAAEAFAAAGVNVEVICLREEGSAKRDFFGSIRVDRVSIKKSRSSKLWYVMQYVLFLAMAFLKLASRSFGRRYHFVHVHNMPDVLVFSALIPKLFGAKVILDLHDPMPELMMTIFGIERDSSTVKWMVRLERLSIAFADIVITVNHACQKIFASRSSPPEKVRVVMNSPDERIFAYSPVQKTTSNTGADRPFVVMYHGTLVDRNGVDLAVEAVSKLRQAVPRVQLRIYGARTPFLDQVMQTVAEKHLQDHVVYLGPKRLEQLREAIAACDVGVIPNKRSIFAELNTPTRIFEYLALGKAVVAPRAPGIQDYFGNDALIYFDLGDVEQLANRLAFVANEPKETAQITERGQQVYLQHSWSMERAKLLGAAADLLAKDASFKDARLTP